MSERIALVELDLERCSLTYGSSPCGASIGVTGADKCFNCLATCQDKTNYTAETVTTTYSYASGDLPRNIDAIPNVKSIDFRPAKLELGESIGIRANVTINFGDSRSPDTGPDGDRYLNARNYDPYQRGTYWGKFRARYPYTKGANIRVLRGTSDQSKEQMEVRHFIVDKVAGPTSSGQFTIVCKDALKLLDGKQAQAPKLSTGVIKTAITAGSSSLTLEPAGVGDETYPTGELIYPVSGFVNIGGNEVCQYTRAGDVLTLVTRGDKNTEAQEHDEGERVQWCLEYLPQQCVDIIKDILVNYAKVPESYIPYADWKSEDDEFIARNYAALIAEPEDASKLVNELLQQTASALWWDDSSKLLRFRVLRAVDSGAARYTDDLIMGGSFSSKDQPEKRVSQVQTYYGQISPLEKLDERKNYSNSLVTVATESEVNFGEPSIKSVYSRWIGKSNRDAAEKLNNLILSRYSTPPRLISFALMRDNYGTLVSPELGGGYKVNSWTMQDATGASEDVPIQTVQVRTSDTGCSVLAEEVLYSETVAPADPTIKPVYIENDWLNLNLYEATISRYPSINEGDTINLIVSQGRVVGSSSTSVPALVLGNGWPNNVVINIINNGLIVGKGGAGGSSGNIVESGGNGGDSIDINISTTSTISITNTAGAIIGGGGGGGGGGSNADVGIAGTTGGGGGAGAGFSSSAGGITNEFVNTFGYGGEGGQSSGTTANGSGGRGGRILLGGVYRYGGEGGDGGMLGQAGEVGGASVNSFEPSYAGAGGLAGNAINKNGNTVTITNNGTIAGNIAP